MKLAVKNDLKCFGENFARHLVLASPWRLIPVSNKVIERLSRGGVSPRVQDNCGFLCLGFCFRFRLLLRFPLPVSDLLPMPFPFAFPGCLVALLRPAALGRPAYCLVASSKLCSKFAFWDVLLGQFAFRPSTAPWSGLVHSPASRASPTPRGEGLYTRSLLSLARAA